MKRHNNQHVVIRAQAERKILPLYFFDNLWYNVKNIFPGGGSNA